MSTLYPVKTVNDQEHMSRVHERWAHFEADQQKELMDRVARVRARSIPGASDRFVKQAAEATGGPKKVQWLRKAVESITAEPAKESACRNGCSHCCYIGVSVLEPEARVIAREIGVPLSRPAEGIDLGQTIQDMRAGVPGNEAQAKSALAEARDKFFGVPCTFLHNGKCQIYQHRPLACRTLLNMDQDDLLCQLVEGEEIRVPYLDTERLKISSAIVLGFGVAADLRDWFPNGLGTPAAAG